MSAPTAPAATAAAKPAAVPAAGASVVPLLKKYLGRVVPAVLDCDGDAVAAALANPENDEALTAFATDSLAFSLLVHKHSVVPPATGDDVFTFELQAKRQVREIYTTLNQNILVYLAIRSSIFSYFYSFILTLICIYLQILLIRFFI